MRYCTIDRRLQSIVTVGRRNGFWRLAATDTAVLCCRVSPSLMQSDQTGCACACLSGFDCFLAFERARHGLHKSGFLGADCVTRRPTRLCRACAVHVSNHHHPGTPWPGMSPQYLRGSGRRACARGESAGWELVVHERCCASRASGEAPGHRHRGERALAMLGLYEGGGALCGHSVARVSWNPGGPNGGLTLHRSCMRTAGPAAASP